MTNGARVGAGLLIAFLGEFAALFLAGAGHGWNTPLWVSTILWITYPWVLVRAAGGADPALDQTALVLAVAADAALIILTIREGIEYFLKVLLAPGEWLLVGLWFLIWVGWQVIPAARLSRRLSRST